MLNTSFTPVWSALFIESILSSPYCPPIPIFPIFSILHSFPVSQSLCSSVSMLPSPYASLSLCPHNPLFHSPYIPQQYLCNPPTPTPTHLSSYGPQALCSTLIFYPSPYALQTLCSPGPLRSSPDVSQMCLQVPIFQQIFT